MKILLISPWENVWVDYMRRYFKLKGHVFTFSKVVDLNEVSIHDVCICGWANEFAEALGGCPKLCDKYILFVRSYEFYHDLYKKINTKNFDTVFTINNFIRQKLVDEKFHGNIKFTRNPIDLSKFTFRESSPGKEVLFLCDVSHKKGIPLFVQIALACPDHNFHIAGNITEARYKYYIDEKLKNVTYHGYIEDVNNLMKSMDYILCTSPVEGNPNNIIEGMACGLKPVIHSYLGYEGQFLKQYCFDTIDEAANMITGAWFGSRNIIFREYIEDKYDMNLVLKELEEACVT